MTRLSLLLIALLVWGVLSFGAVYPWGYWPLAIGAAALGVWTIGLTDALRGGRSRTLAIALFAIAVAIAMQATPLPYTWFKTLSPAGDRLLEQLTVGWTVDPPAWQPLTIDPDATLTALARFVALALLLIGLMRAVAFMPLRWIVSQLMTFGAVLGVFGIAQRAVSGGTNFLIYGFWRPGGPATSFGPFVNRNHFAGWMILTVPLAVSLAVAEMRASDGPARRDRRGWLQWLATPDANRFVYCGTAILIMVTSVVLSGSRSGMAGLVIAFVAFIALTGGQARKGAPAPRLLLVVGMTAVLAAAVVWAGASRTAARFDQAGVEFADRLAVWRDTATVIRDFPITGTGTGSFGSAMLVYQTSGRHSIYEQAHNEYLQILAEGGLLVAIPVLVAVGVMLTTVRRRLAEDDRGETRWLRAGAIASLAGIAAQSMVEFSLQIPGNAAMCVFVLAVTLHRSTSHAHAHRV